MVGRRETPVRQGGRPLVWQGDPCVAGRRKAPEPSALARETHQPSAQGGRPVCGWEEGDQ